MYRMKKQREKKSDSNSHNITGGRFIVGYLWGDFLETFFELWQNEPELRFEKALKWSNIRCRLWELGLGLVVGR